MVQSLSAAATRDLIAGCCSFAAGVNPAYPLAWLPAQPAFPAGRWVRVCLCSLTSQSPTSGGAQTSLRSSFSSWYLDLREALSFLRLRVEPRFGLRVAEKAAEAERPYTCSHCTGLRLGGGSLGLCRKSHADLAARRAMVVEVGIPAAVHPSSCSRGRGARGAGARPLAQLLRPRPSPWPVL